MNETNPTHSPFSVKLIWEKGRVSCANPFRPHNSQQRPRRGEKLRGAARPAGQHRRPMDRVRHQGPLRRTQQSAERVLHRPSRRADACPHLRRSGRGANKAEGAGAPPRSSSLRTQPRNPGRRPRIWHRRIPILRRQLEAEQQVGAEVVGKRATKGVRRLSQHPPRKSSGPRKRRVGRDRFAAGTGRSASRVCRCRRRRLVAREASPRVRQLRGTDRSTRSGTWSSNADTNSSRSVS